MTSYVNLSDIQKKASIKWEINSFANYSECHRPTIDSPIFSPPNDANIKFFLRFTGKYLITPNSIGKGFHRDNLFYSIALCLQSPIQKIISVYYKIALLDWINTKHLPHEDKAVFYVRSNEEPQHGVEYIISDANLCPNIMYNFTVFVLDNSSEKIIENYGTLLKIDLILVVGKKEFNLHKIVLDARSPVFSAIFNKDVEESKQNRITITDMEVDVAELIVPYIYTGELPSSASINKYTLELFIASDKYQLEQLKAICEKKLIETLSVETVAKTLMLADKQSVAFLKKKSIEFITQNSEQVKNTMGWSDLINNRPELIIELYNDLSVKASPFLKN